MTFTRLPRISTRGMLHPSRAGAAQAAPTVDTRPQRVAMRPLTAPPRLDIRVRARGSEAIVPIALDELVDASEIPPSGDLASCPPLQLLCRVAMARETGTLELAIDAIRKTIYLRGGRIEAVVSNLARDAVDCFVVTRGNLDEATQMRRSRTQQIRACVIDACMWRKGQFTWRANRDLPPVEHAVCVDTFGVLGIAALALPDATISAWLAGLANRRLVASPRPRVDPDRFQIPELAAVLASLGDRVEPEHARLSYLLVCAELAIVA